MAAFPVITERLRLVPLPRSSFYYFWKILKKTDETVIGIVCYMEPPNKKGEIEMGFRLNENYRNRGYMTEAVAAICEWTRLLPNVKSIIAITRTDNIPSIQVLRKCRFIEHSFEGDIIWRLNLGNHEW